MVRGAMFPCWRAIYRTQNQIEALSNQQPKLSKVPQRLANKRAGVMLLILVLLGNVIVHIAGVQVLDPIVLLPSLVFSCGPGGNCR
jgi:hypothetical protein